MRSYHGLIAAVLILAAGAATRPASAATAFSGIDALQSTVMQKGQSSFSGIGVRGRMTSARLIPGFDFLPSIEYWRSKTTVSAFGIETSRRDATLALDGRYTFKREGWSPYAGLGYGVHFISNKVNAPTLGLTDEEDSLVKGGLALLGGINFPLNERIDNLLELKYHVLSDYGQLKFSWGLAWDF